MNSLPTREGESIYVRLFYKVDNGSWINGGDYTYFIKNSPEISSPLVGSTIPNTDITFKLKSNGAEIENWHIWVGTEPGRYDISRPSIIRSPDTNLSITLDPEYAGTKVYVRLFVSLKRSSDTKQVGDYTYDIAP